MNEDTPTYIVQSVTSVNGHSLNGHSLNGHSLNGHSLNGVTLNGVSPSGHSLNGAVIGIAATGAPLAGTGVVGSTWTGHLSDGTTLPLRVDQVMQGTGANTDVWSYVVSASTDGTWWPLCVDYNGAPIFADTMRGTWNAGEGVPGGGSYTAGATDFTIACRGSSVAKCVELGYKPWAGHTSELASCVRALRADYCGDGGSYTVDGTIVNIYDVGGIQPDDSAWDAEAEWTADGARCVASKTKTRFYQDAHVTPWCFPCPLSPQNSCGTGFTTGAVIITELLPL